MLVIRRSTYLLNGQAIAVRVNGDGANDGLFYIHSDHLGSASVLSDGAGNQVGETTRFYPFGGYRTGDGHDMMDQGFTGHKHNDDIGLIYMNARYYVPGIGRFASADTIVPNAGNPQSYNRYAYGYNNPIKYNDPTGHCAER